MVLWQEWFRCVCELRAACTRRRTFLWMAVVLVGFSIRSEHAGVTSFVRVLWLRNSTYPRLLNFFHSKALVLEKLSQLWVKLALKIFSPLLENERLVLVADGIKIPKEGRLMPAVKKLHQESGNNSKAEFIFGHSFQALGLLVCGPQGHVASVPLVSRIHEGIQNAPAPKPRKKSLLDKLAILFLSIVKPLPRKAYLVADAYYASRKIILPLLQDGHHLVTRVRRNTIAYRPAPTPRKAKRGRPRLYGDKVQLSALWTQKNKFKTASSPVYGERDVKIQYRVVDLLWRPVGRLVRFVLVVHPKRGRIILLSSDLDLDPIRIIALYGYRFKIESSFKQALHTLGAYAYHFWMLDMIPLSRKRSGDQYLHRCSPDYRRLVYRKMDAYHRFVQLACIAQGLQQYLALHFRAKVWRNFKSWMRTMKPLDPPSEAVVAQALRNTLPDFLVDAPDSNILALFLFEHMDHDRCPAFTLAA